MIRNLIFDVGNVIVTEMGANVFLYLAPDERSYLNHLVYSKQSGFDKPILGEQTTEQYKSELVAKAPQYKPELEILLSRDGMPQALPKKKDVIDLVYTLKSDYKIYFLSNMIDVTYDYLDDILNDFDGGAYSFQEHMKKPDENFYNTLINRYGLRPEDCIFFDDREENIQVAQEIGMQAVLFKDVSSITSVLT